MDYRHYNPRKSLRMLIVAGATAATLGVAPQFALAAEEGTATLGDGAAAAVTSSEGLESESTTTTEVSTLGTNTATGSTTVVSETSSSAVADTKVAAIAQSDVATTEVVENQDDAVEGTESTAADNTDEADADTSDDGVEAEEVVHGEAPVAANDGTVIMDGTYVIQSAVGSRKVLDVAGNKTNNGTNVDSYTSNMTGAQKWDIAYDSEKGYYTIKKSGTDSALDVKSAGKSKGTNVQIHNSNSTNAQYWYFVKNGSGYSIRSALKENYVLDVEGAGTSNGTNVQMYDYNGTAAQRFFFLSVRPDIAGTAEDDVIQDGDYVVQDSAKTSQVIDVASGSRKNAANVQLYKSNGTQAQMYHFEKDDEGFYTITSLKSGKVLDVAGANVARGTNVRQYTSNGTAAQKWALRTNISSDGTTTYTFVNKATGLVLDVASGSVKNGANVQGYTSNGTAAQKFVLAKTEFLVDGQIYKIVSSQDTDKVVDIKSGSASSGAVVQLYTSNNTLAQRFQAYKASDGIYRFRTAASGGWITDVDGAVTQEGDHLTEASDANKWQLVWKGGYYTLVHDADQYALTASGVSNGSSLNVSANTGSASQHFFFDTGKLVIKQGVYKVVSALGTVLDVKSASTTKGANIDAYKDNGTVAQKYLIYSSGDNYVIKNIKSNMVLDVAGGSKADGANVQQYTLNGTSAQLWKATIGDGGYIVFVNVGSGKALDIADGSSKSGANVQQYTVNGSKAQSWKLVGVAGVATDPDGVQYSYKANGSKTRYQILSSAAIKAMGMIKNYTSDTKYAIAIDASLCRVVVFQGYIGNWTVKYDWAAGTARDNAHNGEGAFTGSWKVHAKVYDGGGYYYVTCFMHGNAPENDHSDDLALHSTVDWQAVSDQLGYRVSNGCTRLAIENAKWIYDNCGIGTRVIEYY